MAAPMSRSAHERPGASAENACAIDNNEKRKAVVTIRISRKAFVFVAVVGAAVTASAVIAAWVTSGSGPGYAKALTATGLALSDASASTTADLYPGATGSVQVKVTNPNSFPVRVTSVVKQASSAITSDKGAACNASTGVTFSDQTGLSLDLAAGATTTFTLANAISMSNASDNSCQGAVFTVPVDVTGASNA